MALNLHGRGPPPDRLPNRFSFRTLRPVRAPHRRTTRRWSRRATRRRCSAVRPGRAAAVCSCRDLAHATAPAPFTARSRVGRFTTSIACSGSRANLSYLPSSTLSRAASRRPPLCVPRSRGRAGARIPARDGARSGRGTRLAPLTTPPEPLSPSAAHPPRAHPRLPAAVGIERWCQPPHLAEDRRPPRDGGASASASATLGISDPRHRAASSGRSRPRGDRSWRWRATSARAPLRDVLADLSRRRDATMVYDRSDPPHGLIELDAHDRGRRVVGPSGRVGGPARGSGSRPAFFDPAISGG